MIKLIIVTLFLGLNVLLIGQNGTVKTYFPSGKVESRVGFVNEILEGTSYWYYENGNVKLEKNYSNGKLNGVVKSFYKSGLVKEEIRYSNGMLDGVSREYYENGGLAEVKTYEFGQLVNRKSISYDDSYIAPLSEYEAGKKKNRLEFEDFICSVNICPEPVGGIEEIESNIKYPEMAKQYNLEGRVLISATISKKGIPKNIKIVKGLGLGCDEAAITAVLNTKFVPGRNNGDEVESDVTFPLNFKLPKTDQDKLAVNSENLFDQNEEDLENNVQSASKNFITCDAEICAEPEGGIIELLNKLRYPPNAKRNNIAGDVIVQVKINELGFVILTEIVKSLGYGCDEAAQSAIIKTQFKPAKNNGTEVESITEITVPFILDELTN
ncbi:MAG: TonB family protein [Melioribacteraceae bacterium]|nr:TonB family protein [Melioribacteraceae bacterium]